jgi:hypothetical protein
MKRKLVLARAKSHKKARERALRQKDADEFCAKISEEIEGAYAVGRMYRDVFSKVGNGRKGK